MANSVAFNLAVVVLMCMVVGAPLAHGAITCSQVSKAVGPCIPYSKSGAGPVPPACCSGIRSLNTIAKTTPDRQAACRCLVSTAKGVSGIKSDVVAGIPRKCGVSLPYPIGPNTDCNSIK